MRKLCVPYPLAGGIVATIALDIPRCAGIILVAYNLHFLIIKERQRINQILDRRARVSLALVDAGYLIPALILILIKDSLKDGLDDKPAADHDNKTNKDRSKNLPRLLDLVHHA